MARSRFVKPEFFSDTTIAEVSTTARLFYVGLFCQFDRNGITVDDVKLLKREIFPYDDDITLKDIAKLIDELEGNKRVFRFSCDNKAYLFCPSLPRHQRFHRDEKSKHPESVIAAALDTCKQVGSSLLTRFGEPANSTENGELRTENGRTRKRVRSRATPFVEGGAEGIPIEEIYSEYPHKKGRKDGFRLAAKLSPDERIRLQAAVRAYAKEVRAHKTEKRFIKHFSTFMGCWEEYVPTLLQIDNAHKKTPVNPSLEELDRIEAEFNGGVLPHAPPNH
jgi:hypothetical protein